MLYVKEEVKTIELDNDTITNSDYDKAFDLLKDKDVSEVKIKLKNGKVKTVKRENEANIMKKYTIVDNDRPSRKVIVTAEDENSAKDKGASELKTHNIRVYQRKVKEEDATMQFGKNPQDTVFIGANGKPLNISTSDRAVAIDTIRKAIKNGAADSNVKLEELIVQLLDNGKNLTGLKLTTKNEDLSKSWNFSDNKSKKDFDDIFGYYAFETLGQISIKGKK